VVLFARVRAFAMPRAFRLMTCDGRTPPEPLRLM
jgi:hypothetical protein